MVAVSLPKGLKSAVFGGAVGMLSVAATPSSAEITNNLGYFGLPGLLDMPTADTMEDARLAFSIAYFPGQTRQTLAFQITPRLSGTFRYSFIDRVELDRPQRYDRSFDVQYQLLFEKGWMPGLVVGARDFIGTGIYSGEYLVATKSFGSRLSLTGGIGWGRMGSYNSFKNPLGLISDSFYERPDIYDPSVDKGGTPSFDQWFHGPAALFAGVSYKATDRLTLLAEYSSDAYVIEEEADAFTPKSPLNFGLQYQLGEAFVLGASYMYGAELGISLTVLTNPKRSVPRGYYSTTPVPVKPRTGPATGWTAEWVSDGATAPVTRETVTQVLALEGLVVERIELTGTTVRVRYRNTRYDSAPQAMGHIARVLTVALPPSVETFILEPVVEGMTTVRVTLKRSDIEALEHDPRATELSFARAVIEDAAGARPVGDVPLTPPKRLVWSLDPYIATQLFDPEDPLRFDVGAQITAQYEIAPGLSISTVLRQKIFGDMDESIRTPSSVLPHVRTESTFYAKAHGVTMNRLTLDYFFRPGTNLYGRASVGYLETMFAGVSGEILWKPEDSRFALGADISRVRKRDYEIDFNLLDYEVTTGHVSAYYDFGGVLDARVDVGRYLAGDFGATLSLERTFDNGWKIGAFATLTDVPFDDFGEGSFNKGILIEAPLSWITGVPSTRSVHGDFTPITRDGGQRLIIANRLYDEVRGDHAPDLQDEWGRFWR
jgi:hypothetical protein